MSDEKQARRRHVRVYYHDLQRDYPTIWFDPTCLSTWLRLLTLCDAAWPSPGTIPAAVRRADLKKLQEVGLVTLLEHGLFTMKGWENERSLRASKALASYNSRKDRPSIDPSTVHSFVHTTVGESPSTTARARASDSLSTSTSSSTVGVQGEGLDTFDAYWSLTTRYPRGGGATWLDRLTTTYGSEAVIRGLAARWSEKADLSTLLSRTEDWLLHEARQLDLDAQERAQRELQARRAVPRVVVDPEAVKAELRKMGVAA